MVIAVGGFRGVLYPPPPMFFVPHPEIRAFLVCHFRRLRFSPWGRVWGKRADAELHCCGYSYPWLSFIRG